MSVRIFLTKDEIRLKQKLKSDTYVHDSMILSADNKGEEFKEVCLFSKIGRAHV